MASRPPRVAFVGSGGAARGIAHLGVLRAVEELGFRPSIYVGASAGAVVATLCGQCLPVDTLLDSFRMPWRRRSREPHVPLSSLLGAPRLRELLDPGYHTSGLLSIDAFERALQARLPENDFRRVAAHILLTACDVDGRGRTVFGRGHRDDVPISKAVAASCCVPGLFRPYPIGDRFYIDGEVVRTLSADLAAEAGADVVIVSNIYRPMRTAPDRPTIARRGLMRVINQSLSIVLDEKERRGLDLYHRLYPNVTFLNISPDIGHIGFLDFFAARQLVMRGYRSALTELVAAKARGVFDRRDDGAGSPALN
jgi:NTE family protein